MTCLKSMTTAVTLGLTTLLAFGDMSIQEIKSKTDGELTAMLNSSNGATRCACLMTLSFRFRNPDVQVILPPAVFQAAHSKEVPMPSGLFEKTVLLAKGDSDLRVRLAAVMALSSFKYHTNTTPALTGLLEDQSCIIRNRSAQALIDFAEEYHEPISDKVVQALIDCLDPNNSPDDLIQAATVLGNLGKRGRKALPFLERLEQHNSTQVRECAKEAISQMR